LHKQCVFIDLPGHGNSPLDPIEDTSMQAMALKVKDIVDKNKIQTYAIVGHSMGGYVGLELAHLDPRCEKLVLLNSNFWADNDEKKEDRKRVAAIVLKMKSFFLHEAIPNLFLDSEKQKSEVHKLIKEAEKMDALAIANASLAMAERVDFTQMVLDRGINLEIIQGEKDAIVPLTKMKSLHADDDHLEVINDCGHMCHIEAPGRVMSALQKALNEKRKLN
jgi:pimeloyl-ACP methyl ester carboxylesterase